jgi:hypothetical protein
MVEGQSEQKCPNTDPQKSAQPCGCDEGAGHECLNHRGMHAWPRRVEMHNAKITGIKDSGKRQVFASGAMRDPSEGKIKWSRVTFGPMLRRWAQHLTTAEAKYPDPKPGVPNFSLIEGEEEYLRYKESALRHFMSWFYDESDEDHAAAVFFNINGVEIIKAKRFGKPLPTWRDELDATKSVVPTNKGSSTLAYEEGE